MIRSHLETEHAEAHLEKINLVFYSMASNGEPEQTDRHTEPKTNHKMVSDFVRTIISDIVQE